MWPHIFTRVHLFCNLAKSVQTNTLGFGIGLFGYTHQSLPRRAICPSEIWWALSEVVENAYSDCRG